VVDSADKRRLKDCADELHKILLEERLAGATLLIFMNKQDVAGASGKEEIQNVLNLSALGSRHYKAVGCSAVTGQGLDDGFSWIINDIASRIYLLD
jgi:ADP-ribosylation factor-like protein 2